MSLYKISDTIIVRLSRLSRRFRKFRHSELKVEPYILKRPCAYAFLLFVEWGDGGGGAIRPCQYVSKRGNPQCDATEILVEINPHFSDMME